MVYMYIRLFLILFLWVLCSLKIYANPWSFSEIRDNKDFFIIFSKISKDVVLPPWVLDRKYKIKENSAHIIKVFDNTAYVMSACNYKQCEQDKIAIIYMPRTKEMYGVLLKKNLMIHDHIYWMNVDKAKNPDVIKIILYSALTSTFQKYYWKFFF